MQNEVLIGLSKIAHDPLDWAIKFLTHGTVGHALFIRGNGRIVENFFPRVHERDWFKGEREKTEIYRIENLTPADCNRLERWFDFELQHPDPYSIRDLFRFALNKPPLNGKGCFCSQFVLRGLRQCLAESKWPLVRLEWPDFASPRDLRISPRLIRQHDH